MATPSSQKTTPSPQLGSQPIPLNLSPSTSSRKRLPPDADDDVDPALQAFLSKLHYAKLSRELRARLSYATFKASQNASHVPFNTLESQYTRPSRPSASRLPLSPRHRLSHTLMMPPPPSPRHSVFYSEPHASPAKRVRYTRSQDQRHPITSLRPSSGRSIHDSRSHRVSTEREDMNAAATLTSLLLNRPSGSRSEGSLSRTSSTASTATLQLPSSQQSQGSTLVGSQPQASSASMLAPPARIHTPQPDDEQAAELMLFLATSPSPAQPPPERRTQVRTSQIAKPRILFPSANGDDIEQGHGNSGSGISSSHAFSHSRHNSASQLLPPPPSPQRLTRRSSEALTPNPSFNLGDFINVSPSPSQLRTTLPRPVFRGEGRKLFSDEDEGGLGSAMDLRTSSYRMGPNVSGRSSFLGPALGATEV